MEIKYEKYDRVPCCRARKLFSHESSELMSLFVLGGRVPMKSAQAAQKVALSISSGLIAYLSGRGNWCHPSILNHPLRRLMKYLLTALFDQLTTGLLMSRMGGQKRTPWCTQRNAQRRRSARKIFTQPGLNGCSYFIYVYVEPNQFQYEQGEILLCCGISPDENQFLNFSQ